MPKDISRRSFIKGGLAAIGAMGASSLALPATVKGAGQEIRMDCLKNVKRMHYAV